MDLEFTGHFPIDVSRPLRNSVRFGSDKDLIAVFRTQAFVNNYKTALAGYDVWEDRVVLVISVPGEKGERPPQFVEDNDSTLPNRFPDAWAQYLAGKEHTHKGTPLSALGLPESQIKTLESANVLTVEQLASLHDGMLQKLPPGTLALHNKAKAWVDSEKGAGLVEKLSQENDDLKTKFETLSSQFEELMKMTAKQNKKEK